MPLQKSAIIRCSTLLLGSSVPCVKFSCQSSGNVSSAQRVIPANFADTKSSSFLPNLDMGDAKANFRTRSCNRRSIHKQNHCAAAFWPIICWNALKSSIQCVAAGLLRSLVSSLCPAHKTVEQARQATHASIRAGSNEYIATRQLAISLCQTPLCQTPLHPVCCSFLVGQEADSHL